MYLLRLTRVSHEILMTGRIYSPVVENHLIKLLSSFRLEASRVKALYESTWVENLPDLEKQNVCIHNRTNL